MGGTFRDPVELWILRDPVGVFDRAGVGWKGRHLSGRKPWPDDGIERVIWTATEPAVETWIPTIAEWEEAAEEIMGRSRLRPAPTMIG